MQFLDQLNRQAGHFELTGHGDVLATCYALRSGSSDSLPKGSKFAYNYYACKLVLNGTRMRALSAARHFRF